MKRICILGGNGMLGHVVLRYLREQGFDVTAATGRFDPSAESDSVTRVAAGNFDWCVNCIGVTPRRADADAETVMAINGELPGRLAAGLPATTGLIHASTDGVFVGQAEGCTADRETDSEDLYGRSKRLGEAGLKRPNDHLIRCSVIGPELAGRQHSLMSWFLGSCEAVPGYTNQLWNGLTTLEWAKQCHAVISGDPAATVRTLQPGFLPAVSKFELLALIGKIWNHPRPVQEKTADVAVSRHLLPNRAVPPIEQQLRELKSWH